MRFTIWVKTIVAARQTHPGWQTIVLQVSIYLFTHSEEWINPNPTVGEYIAMVLLA